MKTADVVIGANWGDEGKGLITDTLVSHYSGEALVVRFCGGAQAGHTVTTPSGQRHIFKHCGSGAFMGSPTYLSRYFVCNPILFLQEYALLKKFALIPRIWVDPAAAVTTPFDMMINQMAEEARGAKRHGSCGVGFGETVERQLHPKYALHFADLYKKGFLQEKLEVIRNEWVPMRLQRLGLETLAPEWRERLNSSAIAARFCEDADAFLNCVRLATVSVIAHARHVVFEGSQGLLLDQNHEWFPHVTRAHTGLRNVVRLASDAGLDALRVHYVSRAYATRHGAGPFPHELPTKPYEKITDPTNVPNAYQGSLRFGWLDLDLLARSIARDMENAKDSILLEPVLALTCLDQIDEKARYFHEKKLKTTGHNEFLARAAACVPTGAMLASYGPQRTDVDRLMPAKNTVLSNRIAAAKDNASSVSQRG